ncbi:hypothetical protein NIBR502774_12530 [Rhizobium sp. NIBRBAC000502774]|nr:hypothetical protein NIBR502774_12530 [Rhizobium sp. NIBRBAC000502774]
MNSVLVPRMILNFVSDKLNAVADDDMTLGDLIGRYRPHLEDESVGLRKSWEETFRYALKHYPSDTPLAEFDIEVLATRLADDDMQQQFVAGYIKRWCELIDPSSEL